MIVRAWSATGAVLLIATLMFLVSLARVSADTIYKVSGGIEQIYERDVIVTDDRIRATGRLETDERQPFIQYLRFRKGIVETKSCPPAIVGWRRETCVAVRSSVDEREKIMTRWKHSGHSAELTDVNGRTLPLFNVYRDWRPPVGMILTYAFWEPSDTSIPIETAGASRRIDFSQISKITRTDQGSLVVSLARGESISGRLKYQYAPRTGQEGRERLRAMLCGVSDFTSDDARESCVDFEELRVVIFTTSRK